MAPFEEISKTVKKKLEHHWSGQADAEVQIICLLLLQKNYVDKFSAEKFEQIMFKYP